MSDFKDKWGEDVAAGDLVEYQGSLHMVTATSYDNAAVYLILRPVHVLKGVIPSAVEKYCGGIDEEYGPTYNRSDWI